MRRSGFAWAMLFLVGCASAAAAAPLNADLTFHSPPRLTGDVVAQVDHGVLDVGAGHGLKLSFAGAEGWLVTRTLDYTGPPGGPQVYVGGDVSNESVALSAGWLQTIVCPSECQAILIADAEGMLEFTGTSKGTITFLESPSVYAFGNMERAEPNGFLYRAPAGAVVLSAREAGLEHPSASAKGELTLFLHDAALVVDSDAGEQTLDARRTSTPTVGPLGTPIGRQDEARFLVLRLKDAAMEWPDAHEGLLLAVTPTLVLEGRVTSASASGWARHDGTHHRVDEKSLVIEGAFESRFSQSNARNLVSLSGRETAGQLEGDASRVVVGGQPLGGETWDLPVTTITIAGVIALLLTLKGGTFLYTRLESDTLLRNPNRKRVHERVASRPGATIPDLVRDLGMAEVVVRHHLQILMSHGLVVTKEVGRVRGHFSVGGATPPDAALRLLLRNEKRRRIAVAIASSPAPLSQIEVAELVDVSPRLASYHLSLLEKEGVVAWEGSMPRRYVAATRFSQHLIATSFLEGEDHRIRP